MKNSKKLVSIIEILLGIFLNILCIFLQLDSYWSGMGFALTTIGIIQLIRCSRYQRNAEYRKKRDIEDKDERNRFIAGKAWSWAGILYVEVSALASIVFRIIGKDDLSLAASYSVCMIISLYWISYFFLRRKY